MDFLSALVLLILIIDPLGNVPIFHAILHKLPEHRRSRILIRESLFALSLLYLFLIIGEPLISLLRLHQSTLSISGGLLLFLIALGMIFPARAVISEHADEEPFIVPLATPLIAGPSSLAFILLLNSKFPGRLLEWSITIFIAWLVCFITLLFSGKLFKLIGTRGSKAIERLMGMILILIATEMFLDGIKNYLNT